MAGRGRPCRVAGERARHRVEVGFTDSEMAQIRQFAKASGLSVADLLRIGLLEFLDDDEAGGPRVLVFVNGPARSQIYRRIQLGAPSNLKVQTASPLTRAARPSPP